MTTEYVSVIVITDKVVEESFLFVGKHDEIAKRAENQFLGSCALKLSNWDEYTDHDKEVILDNGYAEYGRGSVCITWPDVVEKDNE